MKKYITRLKHYNRHYKVNEISENENWIIDMEKSAQMIILSEKKKIKTFRKIIVDKENKDFPKCE